MADKEMEARSKARSGEIAAVGKALAILTSHDAYDLFTKTLGFIQEESSVNSQRRQAGGLRMKLRRRTSGPAPSEEKHDCWPLVVSLPIPGSEDLQLEFSLLRSPVDHHLVGVADIGLGRSWRSQGDSQAGDGNGQQRAHVALFPRLPRWSQQKITSGLLRTIPDDKTNTRIHLPWDRVDRLDRSRPPLFYGHRHRVP